MLVWPLGKVSFLACPLRTSSHRRLISVNPEADQLREADQHHLDLKSLLDDDFDEEDLPDDEDDDDDPPPLSQQPGADAMEEPAAGLERENSSGKRSPAAAHGGSADAGGRPMGRAGETERKASGRLTSRCDERQGPLLPAAAPFSACFLRSMMSADRVNRHCDKSMDQLFSGLGGYR